MNLYRYTKEHLAELDKQILLSEFRLVVKGLATTKSYEKINFYIEYQRDLEKEIIKRMN